MHDDPHRSIHVKVTGPDPKSSLFATRCREAWRSFWRHRADEVHAVTEFGQSHAGLLGCGFAVLVMVAISVGPFVYKSWDGQRQDRECSATCEAVGHGDSLRHNGECYCIVEVGRPVLLETLLNRGTVWYVESCVGDK